jgi:hypothetical protein
MHRRFRELSGSRRLKDNGPLSHATTTGSMVTPEKLAALAQPSARSSILPPARQCAHAERIRGGLTKRSKPS